MDSALGSVKSAVVVSETLVASGTQLERFADVSTTFVLPGESPNRVTWNSPSAWRAGEVDAGGFVACSWNSSLRLGAVAAPARNGSTPKISCIVRSVEAWV